MADMHFDNSRFKETVAKINRLWSEIKREHFRPRRLSLFGQLTHPIHDFYAHTLYVENFLRAHPKATPADIVPAIDLIHEGEKSGSYSLLQQLLGADTHSIWNKDCPESASGRRLSPTGHTYFEYAKSAAIKHTLILYLLMQKME
jgi:hypothetical protein